jgi:hypothetical protein
MGRIVLIGGGARHREERGDTFTADRLDGAVAESGAVVGSRFATPWTLNG